MTRSQVQAEALANATQSASLANYPAIFAGFMEKGIPEQDIQPRVNVFTYHAWRALGRQVRRGEHGVKVVTWVPMTKKLGAADGAEQSDDQPRATFRRQKVTTVFHVSQTEPAAEADARRIFRAAVLENVENPEGN